MRRKHDRILTLKYMKSITEFARSEGIRSHMDGARLFVQSAHTGVSPAQYGEIFDTVYTSMWKCFNAPSGAILAGASAFTEGLFHERRMFGGGLPYAWPFAAIALHFVDGFIDDYKENSRLACQSVTSGERAGSTTRSSKQSSGRARGAISASFPYCRVFASATSVAVWLMATSLARSS